MIGITSYGAYIPWHRLDRQQFLKAWGGFAIPGERSVAYFDEDSVTMAVEASMNCLKDFDAQKVDGLYFATTTAPYKEKQSAATMRFALNMRGDIRTIDFNASLRCGSTAMSMAHDTIKAGNANSILVAASDCRNAAPGGMTEQSLGDGAAAFLIGTENVIAEILCTYSISDDLPATWRAESDTFVRGWEDRMTMDEGYSKLVPKAIEAIIAKAGIKKEELAKVVFDPPGDARRHGKVATALGFKPEQLEDPFGLFMNVGMTGSAMSPMMLVSALETAKPGDKILFLGNGDGVDAMILQVTDAIAKLPDRRGMLKHLLVKKSYDNYESILKWRDIVPLEAARRPDKQHMRLSAIWRDRKALLGLWGVKCRKCGTPQYDNGAMSTPPIRICAECQAQDDFDDYCFVGKKAKVFSYTHDQLAPVVDPPASVVLVEFEGGGRAFFDLTDRDSEEVQVGTEVEMTFRKLQFDRGLTNYFWKARPVRF
ncbi:MAG: OB-fold domain-containing protein [Chloroflexota bacterium]|nr:OB-fold domain-containing protein [Chloroflexota bacterium]